jgi:putative spermidine/putrescine transport system substrate-binding protein
LCVTVACFAILSGAFCKPSVAADSAEKSLKNKTWAEITQAAKNQEVVFTSWYDEQDFARLCQNFTQKTGIKARFLFSDAAAVTEKLLAEKGLDKSTIDVVLVGGVNVKTSVEAGLWENNILDIMPSKSAYDPLLSVVQEGVQTKSMLVPAYRNQTGLMYNPEMVSNPPQTLADLENFIEQNPKRFGFCDPSKGGSGQSFIQSIIKEKTGGLEQYMGDNTLDLQKVAKWGAVWQWFNDRKGKITITNSNMDSIMRLNQGELSLIAAWDDDSNQAIKKGELFKEAEFYIPAFGMAGGGDTLGIPVNSVNKEAALVFIDYYTSKEVQQKLNDESMFYPGRIDVEVHNTQVKKEDLKNALAWVPAQYKDHFIKQFIEQVLMK